MYIFFKDPSFLGFYKIKMLKLFSERYLLLKVGLLKMLFVYKKLTISSVNE